MLLAAIRSSLISKACNNAIGLFNYDNVNSICKTKEIKMFLEKSQLKKVLIIYTNRIPRLFLKCLNSLKPRIKCINIQSEILSTYEIVNHDFVFISNESFAFLTRYTEF